jgi:ABC-type sulfate transport system permease component
MFEHLVRDGVILFLAGITILTKVVPTLRLKRFTDNALAGTLAVGWVMTIIGFISMCAGVKMDSW